MADELIGRLRETKSRYDQNTGKHMYDVFCNRDGEEAATRIETLEAHVKAMEGALEPFAVEDFEIPVVDEYGWTDAGVSWCRERIVDWFGPSAFHRARQALGDGYRGGKG